ncbi:ribonuclease HI [Thermosipho atlanticus DSM 15807]|uniref:Ribonuclease HI n=1 Tax=Thermosipho atlanticus DSM 15807 TaxID=1123380 RepID=A0A1M5RZL7_9BACT|nr:ribonuclease HI [Thermosipho atlanticus DSM 15807]
MEIAKIDINYKIGNFKIEKNLDFQNENLKKIYEELRSKLSGFKIVGVKHFSFQEIYFIERNNHSLKIQLFYNKYFEPTKLKILQATDNQIANLFLSHFKSPINQEITKAYVDGSYKSSGKIGAGLVIVKTGGIEKYYKFITKYAKHRNVTGEIVATLLALEYAKNETINNLEIFYDYTGIEMWSVGRWKPKTELTKKYKNLYDKYSKIINVTFTKVKAHTGERFNDLADKLAKKAIEDEKTHVKYDIEI